jgi:RNAse (barnase) inhibitor barstar
MNQQIIKTKDTLFVIIDGEKCKNRVELFQTLQESLSFPDYFGHNLDALFDMLTDLNWLVYDHIYIIILHPETLFKNSHIEKDEFDELFQLANVEQLENKEIRLFLSEFNI